MWHPWRVVKAAYQVARSVQDPERLEDIVELAGVLVPPQKLRRLTDTLWDSPSAAHALRERRAWGRWMWRRCTLSPPAHSAGPSRTIWRRTACASCPACPAAHGRGVRASPPAGSAMTSGMCSPVSAPRWPESWGLQAFSLAQLGSPFAAGHPHRRPGQHPPVRLPASRTCACAPSSGGWLLGKRGPALVRGGLEPCMWERPLEGVRQREVPGLAVVTAVFSRRCCPPLPNRARWRPPWTEPRKRILFAPGSKQMESRPRWAAAPSASPSSTRPAS